ncbi:glutathione S-transferase family protein [Microvirga makkahensis]|uniref:Glutathione S-transferase n=1 Tax=Microvirga makkahensis TaxID=1128670 RepID=A0A7X3SML5_9HYPH|nr:glutathione S-transferase family protein [Microvirga makkahensis]MXQ10370.1 glutathione S-transferase [Microvirga makkahensis]
MLVLRSSPASPFGRKVKIAASLLGLTDRIQIVDADTLNPEDDLRQQNPLGKIPTLVLENGETLYDSRVIVEYLDFLAGGGRMIPAGEARFAALREQALADGILDAALLQVYEGRFRPQDRHEPKWVDHQVGKVERGLAYAEAHLSTPSADLHIGHVALACMLGYLDLRFTGRWRETHPKLVAWLADFEARVPAYAQTRVAP